MVRFMNFYVMFKCTMCHASKPFITKWHHRGWWLPGSLTASVFPEPVCAIPTMSLPLRATGKPWDWIAVGSLKFCCLSTSVTCSARRRRETSNKTLILWTFNWVSNFWTLQKAQSIFSPSKYYKCKCTVSPYRQDTFYFSVWITNEETAPGEKQGSPLGSLCLWLWSPSFCETLPCQAGYLKEKEEKYVWKRCALIQGGNMIMSRHYISYDGTSTGGLNVLLFVAWCIDIVCNYNITK